MRNKFVLSILILPLVAGIAWSQFYKDFSETQRKTLAEACYLAGAQYAKVGKTELGREYKELAVMIYPQLAPSEITEPQQPSAEELLAQGRAGMLAPPEAAEKPGLLPRSFFLRLLGAFLDRDPTEVTAFLDGSVYIDALQVDVSRADAEAALKDFFSTVSLAGVEPGALYNLDSIAIAKAPDQAQKQWGQTSTLRVDARMDFSQQMSFWEESQQFWAHKLGASWYIFAIGPNSPPMDWRPQPLPASAPAAAPSETPPAPDKQIQQAFGDCVSAFLRKDIDATLAYIAQNVRVIRMRQTVSRDELKTTFQGYFESTDFGSLTLSDVVDSASIFVEPSKEFADEIQGPVYALNVKAKVDLSDTVPFWTTYQRYYFTEEDGSWQIFAVF
jgi:hypothetical protein